jgi:hypothetical protein
MPALCVEEAGAVEEEDGRHGNNPQPIDVVPSLLHRCFAPSPMMQCRHASGNRFATQLLYCIQYFEKNKASIYRPKVMNSSKNMLKMQKYPINIFIMLQSVYLTI